MKNDKVIESEGVVEEAFPNVVFSVRIDDENMKGHLVKATLAGRLKKYRINIIPGDRVTVEISVYDLSKGRITYRN